MKHFTVNRNSGAINGWLFIVLQYLTKQAADHLRGLDSVPILLPVSVKLIDLPKVFVLMDTTWHAEPHLAIVPVQPSQQRQVSYLCWMQKTLKDISLSPELQKNKP